MPVRRSTSAIVWLLIVAVLAVVAHHIQQPRRAPGEPVTGRAHVVDGDSLMGVVSIRDLFAIARLRPATETGVEVLTD